MAPITVEIDTSAGQLGASFDIDAGCIIVKSVKKGGWIGKTGILEGHEIISINGENCVGHTVEEVEKLFADASGPITVIADDPMDTQRRPGIKL